MLSDIDYDLIEVTAEISKTLYRMDTYLEDSSDCQPCKEIWNKIRQNREYELEMLLGQLKEHIQSGAYSFKKAA